MPELVKLVLMPVVRKTVVSQGSLLVVVLEVQVAKAEKTQSEVPWASVT